MNKLLVTFVILPAMLFVGCASMLKSNADGESIQDIQTKLLDAMPIPGSAKINNENTLILGDGWADRVAIVAQQNSNETFTFFRDQCQKAGWTLSRSQRKQKNSTLSFY